MNKWKGSLAGSPAFPQFMALLAAVLGGLIVLGGLTLLFSRPGEENSANMLRGLQLMSQVCLFLLPALLAGWLCSLNLSAYLSLKGIRDARVWGLTLVSMLLFSPFITLTGFLNSQMKLPPFMAPVDRWMQSLEASTEATMNLLLADSSGLTLVFNLIVIAVGAGVTEEFFFRGAFRRILEQKIRNPHVLIWVVAAIFSLVHMQFYGFVPRMLLGVYLGYLVYWSKSIWLAVFAHFINNGVAVIGMSSPVLKDKAYISGRIPDGELHFFVLFSFIGLALFAFCVNRLWRRLAGRPA
jgi:membrane protease YdiL (CAAX protease family)